MNQFNHNRSAAEYAQIALSGGGLTLDATKLTTLELAQIAFSASTKGARITIINSRVKTTQELAQIAFAGKGCVSFVE